MPWDMQRLRRSPSAPLWRFRRRRCRPRPSARPRRFWNVRLVCDLRWFFPLADPSNARSAPVPRQRIWKWFSFPEMDSPHRQWSHAEDL